MCLTSLEHCTQTFPACQHASYKQVLTASVHGLKNSMLMAGLTRYLRCSSSLSALSRFAFLSFPISSSGSACIRLMNQPLGVSSTRHFPAQQAGRLALRHRLVQQCDEKTELVGQKPCMTELMYMQLAVCSCMMYTCLAQVFDKLCQGVPLGGVHVDMILVSDKLIVDILGSNPGARM